jgi:hypothetical protein
MARAYRMPPPSEQQAVRMEIERGNAKLVNPEWNGRAWQIWTLTDGRYVAIDAKARHRGVLSVESTLEDTDQALELCAATGLYDDDDGGDS